MHYGNILRRFTTTLVLVDVHDECRLQCDIVLG